MVAMEEKNIRRAINQAHQNYKNSGILAGEIFLISASLGFAFKSWWIFGTALIGSCIALMIPYLGTVLLLALSVGWGAIGWNIGSLFESLGAQVVISGLAFLMGVGIHFSGHQWFKDNAS